MAYAVERRLRKLESRLDRLDKNFISLQEETDSAIVSINKEHTKLFNADAENKKKIKVLDVVSKSTFAKADIARADAAKIAAKQIAFEKSWNPVVLKKIAETLGIVNKMMASIELRDSKNTRNFGRLQASMLSLSKHASDIEAEHTDAKLAARELASKANNLKETVDYFFKNAENLNNRINTNASNLVEVTNALDLIKDKLVALENQSGQLANVSDALEHASRNIDQLVQKVAYLEKATVKTIVLE